MRTTKGDSAGKDRVPREGGGCGGCGDRYGGGGKGQVHIGGVEVKYGWGGGSQVVVFRVAGLQLLRGVGGPRGGNFF